jgi:hypothetical protein
MNYTLAVSTTIGGAWLDVTPNRGKAKPNQQKKHNVTITTVALGLAGGTYTGSITINAPGATNTPQVVPVTLNVLADPTISLSPASLTFSAPTGGPNPLPQPLTLSNVGGGVLNWTAAASTLSGGAWLSVTPAAGALNAGASTPLTVSVDVVTTALASGTYAGSITVTGAPPTTNSPQVVGVTLNVSGTPVIGMSTFSLSFTPRRAAAPIRPPRT